MSRIERLDSYQRRHPWAGFPIGVAYKFFDDQGNYLAALITYYAFLSLFPLLLLGSSILGFVLQGNPDLQQAILDSALRRLPVIGDELGQPRGLRGNSLAVVVGAIGSLYGALGVAQATQNAMNIAWAVPRNRRPNPLLVRARSIVLLALSGLGLLLTTLMSGVGAGVVSAIDELSWLLKGLVGLLTILLNAAIFSVLFRFATARRQSLRTALPGALFVATVWQALQYGGTAYVRAVMESTSATNGVFAVVLGLIAWIYVGAAAVVFGVEINVVRAGHLYPRALLTPFTDDVDLTEADRVAYTRYAQAQRNKGFQSVSVSFDESARQMRKQKLSSGVGGERSDVPTDRDTVP